MTLKVLTANRLIDGEVVDLTANCGWSLWLDEGDRVETPDGEEVLVARAAHAVAECEVVDPYVMPVADDGGRLRPLSQRETIRAKGPSVRTDLGKQAIRR